MKDNSELSEAIAGIRTLIKSVPSQAFQLVNDRFGEEIA
jgi:hypothetical protein